MTDTAPAALPPDTPVTVFNLKQALAELMSKLPETTDPTVKAGDLTVNSGQLTLNIG